MTLNGHYALYCTKHASFGAHHKNYQPQKCGPMTLLSGNIRFLRIFAGVPWGGASNDSGVSTTAIFSVFAGYFSETLEIRPALLYSSNMQSVVGFSVMLS